MTAQTRNRDIGMARARGAAYSLVAHGFQYPDETLLNTLGNRSRWSTWPEVLRSLDDEVGRRLAAVRAICLGAQSRLHADLEALRETFIELFGHAVRGKCPPYELEYGRSEIIQQAAELADLAGFYAAFGMETAADAEGRPDHISAECEFMAAVCAKEAYAMETGEAEYLEVSVGAQRSFLRDHLARWVPAFAHRVGEADTCGLHGALAGFAGALVAAECRRFGVSAGGKLIGLRPTDPLLDTAISCAAGVEPAARAAGQFTQVQIDPTLGKET